MTQAAAQCREYLEDKYPGVRIGRQSCRDTADGFISQHSAYQYPMYDSNALDIMRGSTNGVKWSREDNITLIQTIVDDLNENLHEWSIRKILWQVALHYGHAHIDYYPMCDTRQWCAGTQPEAVWVYSDGRHIRSDNPPPENGEYDGDEMSYEQLRTSEFDLWTAVNIMSAFDRGRFESTDRAGFEDYWVTKRAQRTPAEKARFMTDFYSSGSP
jgi:hypothetical protein